MLEQILNISVVEDLTTITPPKGKSPPKAGKVPKADKPPKAAKHTKETPAQIRIRYAMQITPMYEEWRSKTPLLIAMGDALEKASKELSAKDYKRMFGNKGAALGQVPFDMSYGSRLRAIAKNKYIRANLHALPACVSTLYEMRYFEKEIFKEEIAKHRINKNMTANDARIIKHERSREKPADGLGTPKMPKIKRKDVAGLCNADWYIDDIDTGRVQNWKTYLPKNSVHGIRKNRHKSQELHYGGDYSMMSGVEAERTLLLYGGKGPNRRVIDCFSGLNVRGIVSGVHGYKYDGFDVWRLQNTENREHVKQLGLSGVRYFDSDARTLEGATGLYYFAFFSPPYYDFERYSRREDCLAECRTYGIFNGEIAKVPKVLIDFLHPEAFVCAFIGDVRDGKGELHNIIDDTYRNFKAAGFKYHDRITIIKPMGTEPYRAENSWRGRKLVRRAEVILVFRKP